MTFTLLSLADLLQRLDRKEESNHLLRQVLVTCEELGDPRAEEIRARLGN